jgi:septum formation protein
MIHTILKNKKVILASKSPRRMEIFSLIGLKAIVYPANIKETTNYTTPIKVIKDISAKKCENVYQKMNYDDLVISADTIVYKDKKILGKPQDEEEAIEYLKLLSHDTHFVYTGITIAYKHNYYFDYAKSKVEFIKLTDKDIYEYIQTKEPFDKAGAYGIQGYGSQFIKKIHGCYFNVMGFPISLFYKMIKDIFNGE